MIAFYKHNEVPKDHHAALGRVNASISGNDVLVHLRIQNGNEQQVGMIRNWITANCPDESHFISSDWNNLLVIIPISHAAIMRLTLEL